MQIINKKFTRTLALGIALSLSPVVFTPVSAASIDDEIAEQQKILDELNKKRKNPEKLRSEISDLEAQLEKLNKRDTYDSKKEIEALSKQISGLREQLDAQAKTQDLLMKTIERLDKLMADRQMEEEEVYTGSRNYGTSTNRLVNPGPQGEVSYTQDARNAQNNSTMVFNYAPEQLYKIYCRVGYLTDIELHKGETINFVGGGDTSAWAINSSTVNGYPHIYIKPVVETSTTNIIVTTDKRSYQLIVCTSDWYNPMVRWTYGQEELMEKQVQKRKDDRTITDRLSVTDMNKLHFSYHVSVKGDEEEYKPEMVFDDGEKTIIRYKKLPRRLPALFIRDRGTMKISLANFRSRQNTLIIDRVVDRAELKFSESDIVTIVRGK